MLTLSASQARKLFLTQQRLAGPAPEPTPESMLSVARALGCLQLDPLTVVARSHQLVLFSRLGPYSTQVFDRLLFEQRALFEYWAHCASIVLTEDYPIHNVRMRSYLQRESTWSLRTREWLAKNAQLRRAILAKLRRNGPTLSREFEEAGQNAKRWVSTGWTSGRNVSQMLDHLWMEGKIMVVGRQGTQKLWDLSERHLPDWTPRARLSEREMTRQAALKSLRALGVGTARHISYHFTRGHYRELPKVLAELEAEGHIRRVQIGESGEAWPGVWYLASEAAPALEQVRNGKWTPRTTLLSPFDNLICDRDRTAQLFNFHFRIEIYTPPAKRKFGYYVLPILHGEQLIGRIDPKLDRDRGSLTVNAVHAEPRAPRAGAQVRNAIESLATFLGATEINYNRRRVAPVWKRELLA